MALEGKAPKLFAYCNKSGVPIYAMLATLAWGCLAFLQLGEQASVVLDWIINLVTAAQMYSYTCILFTYIMWRRCTIAQGVDRENLPFKAWYQPYLSYCGMFITFCMLWVQGYTVFLPGNWSIESFLFSYLMIFIDIALFIFWKVYKRTKFVRPEDADITTGLREVIFHEKILAHEEAKRGPKIKRWFFHISQKREINPLLPFDLSDTLENEDLEQKNKKLEKEKKKIEKEKKKQNEKAKEEENNDNGENENGNDNENGNGNERDAGNINDKTNQTSQSRENTKNGNGVANNNGNNKANSGSGNGNDGNGNGNGNGNKPLSPIEEFIIRQREKEEKRQEKEEEEREKEAERKEENWSRFKSAMVKSIETGLITFSSLLVLAISGLTYHELYKKRVLDKISDSFDEGDPTFQLQKHRISVQEKKYWVEREQQKFLDDVVTGKITGRYLLLVGEKGVGKTSSIMESIRKVNGKNCAIIDCSSDLELMRIRIGAALNFEFHEDYIGALFSIRGPRDTTALLDIERAFGKLEEVALKRVSKTKEPLVLVFNDMHLIKDDEEGIKLVELLQQKAESLSGSRLATIIFNSDDYWVYENLKKLATRLEVVHFKDLNREEAIRTLKVARMKFFNDTVSDEDCNKIYNLIGGRPQHISHVAGHQNW
ncbi:unnamed protein product [[Candida] boidinii]|nr:unnamed protein product [[Candida] boidinii]